MKKTPKKNQGTATFGLIANRNVSYAGAPCSGYYNLVEFTSKDSTDKINSPSMYDLIERALGHHPEFGTEFEITVQVKVTRRGVASTKACHNPWSGHTCRAPAKKRRARLA